MTNKAGGTVYGECNFLLYSDGDTYIVCHSATHKALFPFLFCFSSRSRPLIADAAADSVMQVRLLLASPPSLLFVCVCRMCVWGVGVGGRDGFS